MALVSGLLCYGLAPPWWWLAACVVLAFAALWRPLMGRLFLVTAAFALGGLSGAMFVTASGGRRLHKPLRGSFSKVRDGNPGIDAAMGTNVRNGPTRREYAVVVDWVTSRNSHAWRIESGSAWVRARLGLWRRWPGPLIVSGPGTPPVVDKGDLVLVSGRARRWRGRTYLWAGNDLVWMDLESTARSAPMWFWVRRKLEDLIRPLHGEGGTVLWAMLLGGSVPAQSTLRWSFIDAGLIHLLVISGLHLALLSVLVFWLWGVALRRSAFIARRWPVPRVAAAATLPVVWGYVLLVGRSPATFRAAVMVTTILGGQMVGRRSDSVRAVMLSGILLLLWRPDWLTHPGFQLSYAATGALIWLARSEIDVHGPFPWVAKLGEASLVASVGTAGLVAYHFGRMSVLGPLTNLVAVPLFCWVVLPLGFFGLVIGLMWPWFGGVFLWLAALVAQGGVWFVRSSVAWMPGMRFAMQFSLGMCLAYYGLLVAAARGWTYGSIRALRRWRWAASMLFLAAVGLLVLGWWEARPPREAVVVSFMGLGKGEAVLVELPSGHRILVDGGPSGSEHSTLVQFLRRKDIRRLDLVVATHPHADHVEGLIAVVRRFHVGELWVNGEVAGAVGRQLVHEARRRGVVVGRPRSLRFGAVRLDVVQVEGRGSNSDMDAGPGGSQMVPPGPDPLLSVNDNSLVVRLITPWGSVLLTGDIEVRKQDLLASGGTDLRADVFKAPHHGSFLSVSKAFVERIHPSVVVICGGPGKDVSRSVALYRSVANHVFVVFRGMVIVRLDQRGIHVAQGYRQR